jgi:carboxymethylenebutenolidase
MGGHVAWIGGCSLPLFKALVVYYGGGIRQAWGNDGHAPIDLLPQVNCPIIGFFGKADGNPSPADMAALSETLDRHAKAYEFHAYDNAVHAFQNFNYPERFHRQATEDSTAKMLAFLGRTLR